MKHDQARQLLRTLQRGFGELMVHRMGDGDTALSDLASTLVRSDMTREQLAELAAFATRRLWSKRSTPVKYSVN